MELISIFYAVIIGIFLVIGDHLAISVGATKSRKAGLASWIGFVASPIAVTAFVNYRLLVIMLPVSAVLSGLLFLRKRFHVAGEFES